MCPSSRRVLRVGAILWHHRLNATAVRLSHMMTEINIQSVNSLAVKEKLNGKLEKAFPVVLIFHRMSSRKDRKSTMR